MNKDPLNRFADYPNYVTAHPGWSEFHYLLAALTSLLLLFGFLWFAGWLDNRALWSKGNKRGATRE
jgi:hypothetical protein